ncbi:MAG: Oligosaccharide flippase family protein [Thermoproteota archaeon]|nr:Oligosaccharide flippase family protein [Thermoproteota archaeon]
MSLQNNVEKVITQIRSFLKAEIGLVYTTVGQTGSSLLGGVFWLLLASLLSVENYGLTNYYIALASIFSATALFGLDATVISWMAKGDKRILFEANSIVFVSGLTVAALLSIFQWPSGFLSFSMVFFMMTLAETFGKKKYKEYAVLSIGNRLVQIGLSVALYFPLGLIGIVLGYFFGNLIFSFLYLKTITKFTTKMESVKSKRSFALHSYGFNLIKSFTNYLDKIIIAPIFGYYVLGLYQLGFQFFMFLSIIPLSLYYYLLPEESSGSNKDKIKILGFVLSVIAALAVFALTPFLVGRFFASFVNAIPVVRVMCFAVIPSTIVSILNASLLGRGKSKTVLIAGLIYLASLITFLIFLGQNMGAFGLALTLVIAQSFQAIYLLLRTLFPLSFFQNTQVSRKLSK